MASENTISIYKIDTDNIFFGGCKNFTEMIERIIQRGNDKNENKRQKNDSDVENYEQMSINNNINRLNFNINLYHSFRSHPNSWSGFLKGILENSDIPFLNKEHDFIVFVYDNEYIFCFTGGIASNLVNDICDEKFPKDLMIKLSDPTKIKQAKSRGITGAFYAKDLYFRGDYSISSTEAFGSVWKDFCASIRSSVANDPEWQLIIGNKKNKKINCDIKNSFKIRKKVTFELAVKLIKKLRDEYKRELTDAEKLGFSFLNNIKFVKDKCTREKLNLELAKKAIGFLNGTNSDFDYDFCHKNYADFLEADRYIIKKGKKELANVEEIFSAIQVLNEIRGELDLKNLDNFYRGLSDEIKVSSYHDKDNSKDTTGTILEHLHGELNCGGKTYFLIDKEWCLIEEDFLDVLSKDFKGFINFRDTFCDIELDTWTNGGEGEFNKKHLIKKNCLVGDRITLDGIEFFDLLFFDDENLYIVQVKDGLGSSTRDACSQLRNSGKLIEESIKSNNHQKIRDLFKKIKSSEVDYTKKPEFIKQLDDIGTEEDFLELFLKKNRKYILAFRYGDSVDEILNTKSNIAKFEILNLREDLRSLGSSLKLFQIKK